MPQRLQNRPVLRYVLALIISGVAIASVSALEPVVGFVPSLFLAAVALAEAYAGIRPAVAVMVLCTAASLLFLEQPSFAYERIHDLAKLAVFPIVAIALIFLMESRRVQQRVVEEQLLELSTLLNSMPEAVFIFDAEGHVAQVNRIAEKFCDRSSDVLFGQHYTDLGRLLSVKDEDKPVPHHETAVARALQGQVVLNEARVFVNPKDNSGIEAVVSASPMRDGDGRLIGALLLVRDVTELRHLQQRMNDAERHVAIGQMASGIAHDFNNVLNSIIQATAVLRLRNGPNDDRETYIAMIENAARRGAEIIGRVREYVRGGTGKVDNLSVEQLVREVLDLTEPMWRGEDNLQVETRLAPVNNVRANGADLRRVLTNLVVNAIQAMPNGGRLKITSGQNGRRDFIAVEDTGIGISRQDQPKIFAPFYTTKPTGTGLGLSMAQRILLAEGGNITFVSEPGRGTKFTVDLPVASNKKESPARAA